MKKNDIVTIQITGMTTEGNGVGKYDGMAIFVPFTCIGDVVEVKIVKLQKSFCYGIVENIVTYSDDRVENDCEVFTKCGGCSFRHISYKKESEIKQSFVKDAFKRIAHLDVDFEEFLPSQNTEYYRNKAQYPVASINGKVVCGFYNKRSHRVIPFTGCKLQPVVFSKIVDEILEFANKNNITAYDEETKKGLLRHIYIRKGYYTNQIMVCFVVTNFEKDLFLRLSQVLVEKFDDIKSIVLNKNSKNTNVIMGKDCKTIFGEDIITDIMCGNKIELSPHSFYQVNTPQAEVLYKIAKEYADVKSDQKIIELYCGAGTIGLSMAKEAGFITAVEIVPEAIENAKKNAKINNINNINFVCSDAGDFADKISKTDEKSDVIIIDPPRKGCDRKTIDAMINISPEKIVVISCNPATAARDCELICSDGKYKIEKAKAVDLFPRTTHVECVVLMSRA